MKLQKIAMAVAGLGLFASANRTFADTVSIGASQDATLLGGTDAIPNNSLASRGFSLERMDRGIRSAG